jgi:hypothetical protein
MMKLHPSLIQSVIGFWEVAKASGNPLHRRGGGEAIQIFLRLADFV